MYNAWLDLFIKLPCFGLFREKARGRGPRGRRVLSPRICLTHFLQVFAATATCHLGYAAACQGSEVGGQPGGRATAPGPGQRGGRRRDTSQKESGEDRWPAIPGVGVGGGGLLPGDQPLPQAPGPVASVPAHRLGTARLRRSRGSTPGLCLIFPPGTHSPWGGSLPHTLPSPALKAIPRPPVGSFPGGCV